MRSHYWGALVVVVASGDLDGDGAERLGPLLRKLQRGTDLVVDLWDVTYCGPEGVTTLKMAKARAHEAGWGFAVVADPAGACAEALTAADLIKDIPTFAYRHAARAAIQS
jgi:anti-anti-sigma regulatory factor